MPTGVSQLHLIADSGGLAGDRFVRVFDVLDSGFKDWTFSAFGLIFVVIGIVIFIFPNAVRAVGVLAPRALFWVAVLVVAASSSSAARSVGAIGFWSGAGP